MIGSIHMDNSRIRSPDNRSRKSYIRNPDNQIQFPRPSGFAIYVARLPSAPFASTAFDIG